MGKECEYCSRTSCDGCLVDFSWILKYPVIYYTGTSPSAFYDSNRYELVEKKDCKNSKI